MADASDCQGYSPVLVDVDGDGFELTSSQAGVLFDIDGNGVPEQLAWTSAAADDAWLVLDRNGNGVVDNGRELFGNFTPQPPSVDANGFVALAAFDAPQAGGNADGWIDAADAVFPELRLWRDSNHDGISQAGELRRLSAAGLVRVSLEYRESRKVDQWGNEFRYRAKVRDSRGGDIGRWAFDVFLARPVP